MSNLKSFSRETLLFAFAALVLLFAAGCAPAPTPAPTPPPAASAVLQSILTDCWGVGQLKDLDGTRPEQLKRFECARPRLLSMARQYPGAAESHRLLAWGYYYALKDELAANAEYERAAEIYGQVGHTAEQSEMFVQLASLAFKYDRSRGCTLLVQAHDLDPTNARAEQLLHNFDCPAP